VQILDHCPEICWHYIGHLQRNKVNKIVGEQVLFVSLMQNSSIFLKFLNSSLFYNECQTLVFWCAVAHNVAHENSL